jgi:putative hemolysin
VTLGDVFVDAPTLLLIAALVLGSFVSAGTETAFFSLQKVDRERLARAGTPTGRQTLRLMSRKAPLITTILLVDQTLNVALAATTGGIAAAAVPAAPWLNVVVLTPFAVLLTEITPKVIAFRFRRQWSALLTWPITVAYWALFPARVLITGIVSALARLLGAQGEASDAVAEEELLVYVEGAAVGELDPSERDIIEAVFEFDELTVDRLMTPRPDVFSVPLSTSWDELLARVRETELSRVPITGIGPDDIVGVLLVKDLLRFRGTGIAGPRQLRSLLLPPVFVPASKDADSMLNEFLERRFHMAFVVDEHGTFVGLVTLDDLLGELLGRAEDESEEDSAITRGGDHDVITVKASMDLEDFAEETGIVLPEGEYHTLGGFVFHELGRLPRKGDAVTFGRHRFKVLHMKGRRISELSVYEKKADQPQGAIG